MYITMAMSTTPHLDEDHSEAVEMLEHMASFRHQRTGIDNTIFLSPKGHARQAARIKVAIDPFERRLGLDDRVFRLS